ncbi:unnamed protein product [Caenorhabditis sp. 36 PRJEB53466]|nr:unnamed protein product [Caenorhabditis sp. 36 PRJEB53466]
MSVSPVPYLVLKTILSYVPVKNRKLLARRIPRIRSIDNTIPYRVGTVEISYDEATSSGRVWIDGTILTYKVVAYHWLKVTTCKGVSFEMDSDVLGRCLEHYLNRPNLRIDRLTLNKAKWPCVPFFPQNVGSLKIVSVEGMTLQLIQFKNRSFERVIVENQFKRTEVFSAPMVYQAKQLLVNSVEIWSSSLLDMPMHNVTIRERLSNSGAFVVFCEKIRTSETVCVGSSYTGIFVTRVNVWREMKRRWETRKTMWNGKKTRTVEMENDREMVIYREQNEKALSSKRLFTARVLQKGTSTERRGVLRNLFSRPWAHIFINQ